MVAFLPALIGGVLGAATLSEGRSARKAARSAAEAQRESALAGIEEQRAARESFEQRTDPFRLAGQAAIPSILQELDISVPQDLYLPENLRGFQPLSREQIESEVKSQYGMTGESNGKFPDNLYGKLPGSIKKAISLAGEQRQKDIENEINQRLFEQETKQKQINDFFNKRGGNTYNQEGNLISEKPLVDDRTTRLFDFLSERGRRGIEESAAAQGRLRSGGTLENLTEFQSNLANQFAVEQSQRRFNNLFNLLGLGSNAATGQGTAGLNTASNISNLLTNAGQAQAQGITGAQQASANTTNQLAGILGYGLRGGFNSSLASTPALPAPTSQEIFL